MVVEVVQCSFVCGCVASVWLFCFWSKVVGLYHFLTPQLRQCSRVASTVGCQTDVTFTTAERGEEKVHTIAQVEAWTSTCLRSKVHSARSRTQAAAEAEAETEAVLTVAKTLDIPQGQFLDTCRMLMTREAAETDEVPHLQFVDKTIDASVVTHRQVPTVRKVQQTVEVLQIQFVDMGWRRSNGGTKTGPGGRTCSDDSADVSDVG